MARLRAGCFNSKANYKNISSQPFRVMGRLRGHAFFSQKEDDMLDVLKKTLGLDEESKKRRAAARKRVREEERKERAERVRQDAEALKKIAK
jgi:hypothetical protein